MGMAFKIMNARLVALPSFLSEVFLPPSLPSLRLLSLPRRLKSDQLFSLYFSLSMAPATTSAKTHSHDRNGGGRVASPALERFPVLFGTLSPSLWLARPK